MSQYAPSLELSDLDGVDGFKLNGVAAHDKSGGTVSGAGDVNGDGFDDFLISGEGAPGGTYVGAAYVVFGKASGFGASFNLASLDGGDGFRLSGVTAYAGFSRGLSGAGDINGDGFDDIIVSTPYADGDATES